MKSQGVIVLKNKVLLEISSELKNIAIAFFVFAMLLKIVFYNENTLTVLWWDFSLFYIIFLPGFFIVLCCMSKINFIERCLLAIPAGTAAVGVISYYLGVVGLNVKYHFVAVPLAVVVISIIIYIFINKNKEIESDK